MTSFSWPRAVIALAGFLMLGAVKADAQIATRQVLLLQSFGRGYLVYDSFAGDFRVELDRLAGVPINVVQVVAGPTGSIAAPDSAVLDYVHSNFAGRRAPDLIVTLGGPAAIFAQKYRQQLFPEAPLVFASVYQKFLVDVPLADNETAVAVNNDLATPIEDMLHVLPETRQVFMILGSGPLAKLWRREVEESLKRFDKRLTLIWSGDMSFEQLLRRSSTLPPRTAILFYMFGADAAGSAYADERVLGDLHAAANAPMFAMHSVYFGRGIVGGRLVDIEGLARKTADVAVRILSGAPPSSLRMAPQLQGAPVFDWRELQRWDIPESRLPTGAIVRYARPSPWEEYRLTILSAAALLVVQALLILGLMYQRRERRRAEIESKKNLALAADVSRRQTMSALTNTMAHEIGQPLTSIIVNARALQLMTEEDRAGAMEEILSDIEAQGARATQIIHRHRTMLRSREVEKKPVDLHDIVKESLALVVTDMDARMIETTLDLSSSRCIVNGDQVLLQQVLVNLLINAVDAMAEMPPERRRLKIRTERESNNVAVCVGDTGTGFTADASTLFTPFVTTKAHGLGIGLTIASSIAQAHGGAIRARNDPDGGATFTLTLPRAV